MTTAHILVTPKRSVLDPQGEAVKRALSSLGLSTITSVCVGKFIELELSESSTVALKEKLSGICHELLSNPVIEDYQLTLDQPEVIPTQADHEGLKDSDQEPESVEDLVKLEAKPKKARKSLKKLAKKEEKSDSEAADSKEDKPKKGKKKKKKKKKEKSKVKAKSKKKGESTIKNKELKDLSA